MLAIPYLIGVLALVVAAAVARQFRRAWLGIGTGVICGAGVFALLYPAWLGYWVSRDQTYISLEGLPD